MSALDGLGRPNSWQVRTRRFARGARRFAGSFFASRLLVSLILFAMVAAGLMARGLR